MTLFHYKVSKVLFASCDNDVSNQSVDTIQRFSAKTYMFLQFCFCNNNDSFIHSKCIYREHLYPVRYERGMLEKYYDYDDNTNIITRVYSYILHGLLINSVKVKNFFLNLYEFAHKTERIQQPFSTEVLRDFSKILQKTATSQIESCFLAKNKSNKIKRNAEFDDSLFSFLFTVTKCCSSPHRFIQNVLVVVWGGGVSLYDQIIDSRPCISDR